VCNALCVNPDPARQADSSVIVWDATLYTPAPIAVIQAQLPIGTLSPLSRPTLA
jgi:hypothetical protein